MNGLPVPEHLTDFVQTHVQPVRQLALRLADAWTNCQHHSALTSTEGTFGNYRCISGRGSIYRKISKLLLARTFLVVEPVDDRAARNSVKCQRLHVLVVDEIFAQFRIVGAQHPLRRACMDIALAVVTGVEQQRGAALDADVAQAQEQRAIRLAMALDAKQFAAGIGTLDLGPEILLPPPLLNFRK